MVGHTYNPSSPGGGRIRSSSLFSTTQHSLRPDYLRPCLKTATKTKKIPFSLKEKKGNATKN